jgi:MFS transporter, DHA2 family, methylenomycin A resistance protein
MTRPPRRAPETAPAVTLTVASVAFLMVSLDATIVNVALPTLGRGLRASLPSLQWVVDGYTLVYAAVLITGGGLGDILDSRGVFMAGLAVFSAASLGCGLAPSTSILISARFVQGLGAALLVPTSLALLRNAFEEPEGRSRAVAVWTAAGGAAIAAGPVLGGVLISTVGWRSIFLINVVIGALALMLTARRVERVPANGGRIDVGGQVTATLAIGGLTFAIIEGPHMGWAAPSVAAALVAAVFGSAAFVVCERRVKAPMLPPALAREPIFRGAAAIGALFQFGFYGQVFVLSLFFQQARGESPLKTGLSFLPMTALVAVSDLLAPRLARRIGQLTTIVAGELVLAAGFIALIPARVRSPSWTIAVAMLPIGIGAGVIIVPLTDRLLTGAPAALAGVATGAFNASRQVGAAIGVAAFGAVLTGGHGFIDPARLTFVLAAAAALLAVPVTTTLRAQRESAAPGTTVPRVSAPGKQNQRIHGREAARNGPPYRRRPSRTKTG